MSKHGYLVCRYTIHLCSSLYVQMKKEKVSDVMLPAGGSFFMLGRANLPVCLLHDA